jgi:hypothetical protein
VKFDPVAGLVANRRLRATITIEVDASDYREAAHHQERLESHLTSLRGDYPEARITVSERRTSGPPTDTPSRSGPRPLHVRSGRLNAYE